MVTTENSTESAPDTADPNGVDLIGFANAVIEQSIPAMHSLGIRVVEMRPGYAAGTAPLAGNGNHLGTMYAGTLFGVAEMLGGALFASTFDIARFAPTVKDLQIRFRRPATTDVRAEAHLDADTIGRVRGEADRHGKAEFVLDATITDSTGEVVARSRGVYQIRAHSA